MLPPFASITPLPGGLALQGGAVEGGRLVLEARGGTRSKRQMYGRGNIDLLFARVAQAI